MFADGLKYEAGTGAEFLCGSPHIEGSFKLNDYKTVF